MNNMTFFGAINSALINYFNFSGRARRKEFWYFSLFSFIVNLILVYSSFSLFTVNSGESSLDSNIATSITFFIIYDIIGWVITIPVYSVGVRRLHDIGKSGKILLFFAIPTIINQILGLTSISINLLLIPIKIIYLITAIPLFIILIVWFCKDSQPGANKWGENPKGINGNNNINEQAATA